MKFKVTGGHASDYWISSNTNTPKLTELYEKVSVVLVKPGCIYSGYSEDGFLGNVRYIPGFHNQSEASSESID